MSAPSGATGSAVIVAYSKRGRKNMDKKNSKCKDNRKCCFRNEFGHCNILVKTYEYNGECNFAKAHHSDYSYNHMKRIEVGMS